MRVGIEVGGTFTDLVAVDGGRVEVVKAPSTSARPPVGAFASLKAASIDPARIRADEADGIVSASVAVGWPAARVTAE